METLLDWITPRTSLAAAGIVVLLLLADRFGGHAARAFDLWRHPYVGAASGGEDITAELERQRSVHFRALYARVSAEIAAARDKGLDVGNLQQTADSLLAFDNPRYRTVATDRLNKLRLAVPQSSERVRTASLDEPNDEIPTPKSVRARSR
jgi:hypothetical protein